MPLSKTDIYYDKKKKKKSHTFSLFCSNCLSRNVRLIYQRECARIDITLTGDYCASLSEFGEKKITHRRVKIKIKN